VGYKMLQPNIQNGFIHFSFIFVNYICS